MLTSYDAALTALGWRVEQGLQLFAALAVAGMHHPPLNPDTPALLVDLPAADTARLRAVLRNQYPPDYLCYGLGNAGGQPFALAELGQQAAQAAALFLPAREAYTSFEAFQEIIAHLRAPEGCPWDRKQTHESLRPFLLEEAHEVLETIDNGDWGELANELGDLLLQIVLHTQIATEHGTFQMRDVLRHVNTKMIRRHPHVWGDVEVQDDAAQVVTNWEAIKQAEKANSGQPRASLLDGLPKDLPALLVAYKYQERAAKVGFDWPDVSGVQAKLREELDEIMAETDPAKQASEIGDVLFVLVNWLRWLKVDDPESLLRAVNAKFYRRFRYIEQHAPRPLAEMTLAEMDAYWNQAKAEGL